MLLRITWTAIVLSLLPACTLQPPKVSPGAHLGPLPQTDRGAPIPPPVSTRLPLPPLPRIQRTETYSVVVSRLRVQELLFSLARDARINLDIHPGIEGTVTLNAIDQTLPQILTRLARQVDIRFEFDGDTLIVMPDTPVLRTYRIDYVNLNRSVSGTVSTNTQIATTGTGSTLQGSGNLPGSGLPAGGNVSATRIENSSRNQFWESVEKNIRDILRETDKILPEGSSETLIENVETSASTGPTSTPSRTAGNEQGVRPRNNRTPGAGLPGAGPSASNNSSITAIHKSTFREAASVIANRETGILTVRATGRQHEKVREFIDQVMEAARRQVLIEATIVEVVLGDAYQQGIEWSRLLPSGTRYGITSPSLGTSAGNAITPFSLAYQSSNGIDTTVRLLESFGTVKVLSSPKLAVLNN
ncbi:secretin N-terminal domain-containing protein, partial [Zoogloea sp.]|uniref:secretin N-terminal domain-containing protein n=1 Tax=Zoogloea sp. TaxID=49181 RepID=UPI0026294C30